MKVKDLKVGTIYKCLLSKVNILVIMTPEQKDDKGKVVSKPVKAGKAVVFLENGDYKFVFSELHDGQLEEVKKQTT